MEFNTNSNQDFINEYGNDLYLNLRDKFLTLNNKKQFNDFMSILMYFNVNKYYSKSAIIVEEYNKYMDNNDSIFSEDNTLFMVIRSVFDLPLYIFDFIEDNLNRDDKWNTKKFQCFKKYLANLYLNDI